MNRLWLGLLCGLIYGALSAASMIPLEFPDKRAALLGAFLNRLSIGVVIGAAIGAPQLDALGMPRWALGLGVGVLLSLADAVITKAYRTDSRSWCGRRRIDRLDCRTVRPIEELR